MRSDGNAYSRKALQPWPSLRAHRQVLAKLSTDRDRPTFFAERIDKAVSGLGTRDSTLIRVIISRSEVNLKNKNKNFIIYIY